MNSTFAAITSVVVIAFLIFIGPVLTIYSLNTLFALAIPLNIYTWLSTLWLGWALFPKSTVKISKE